MKKIISILLTASILAGSTAIPLTAVSADTAATVSQASEASKKASLVVVVYNEDEGSLYTDEHTSFMICGNPDQAMDFGMGGSTFLCSVKPSERNPFSLEDINIVPNTRYTVIDTASPDYDGFNYHIDRDRSDLTFNFSEEPDQWISIYMKKYYFIDTSDKSVTAATHGQDVFDNVNEVGKTVLDLINSDDFKVLDTADRISKAKELMKSLADKELIADYSFDEAGNVMSFTYKCGNITGQLRPPVFEDEHKQLKQNDTAEAEEEVSYRIVRLPDKVEYKIGEGISLKGIQAEVIKSNEEPVIYTYPDVAFDYQSNIPKPATVLLHTDFRSDKAGTYKVEVVGAENAGFEVKVVDDSTEKEREYSFEDIRSMSVEELKGLFDSKGKGYTVWTKEKILNMRNTMIGGISVNILPDPDKQSSFNDSYLFSSEMFWEQEKLEKALGLPKDLFEIAQIMKGFSSEGVSINCYIYPKAADEEAEAELYAAAYNYIQLSPYFVGFSYEMLGGTDTTTTAIQNPTDTTTTAAYDVSEIKGDANCDGRVDISDAVLIMQSIANPSKYKLTDQGRKNADMDGDGITSGDALAIQKKLLKLE